MKNYLSFLLICCLFFSCGKVSNNSEVFVDSNFVYKEYTPKADDVIISRSEYKNRLHGFWLGQCIANWTGLVTEMDKIGNIGNIKTGDFYTRENWGKPDHPSIWGEGIPSKLSETIDFVFEDSLGIWGADDDTDIEYIYQHLLYSNKTSILTPVQIRDGWLKYIKEEENYLWVSNQTAYDLMLKGILPPETGNRTLNPNYEMIDAQLTTEIFGLFSPTRPDFARKMASLPIRTTARENAEYISEFYVTIYSLSASLDKNSLNSNSIVAIADKASEVLHDTTYSAKMYDFVRSMYFEGYSWEQTRDSIYVRYQVKQEDGYDITSKNIYCNGCFSAGINFAASLVSLFYGEGNLIETIKIGTLAGWDSDNPTATWGGLIGFVLGKDGVENAFNRKFSEKFNIHRTRQNFENAIDNFSRMAEIGVYVTDRVIQEELKGGIDLEKNEWYIPKL